MRSIPLEDGSIGVILCLEGFEHVSEETAMKFIAEGKRVLRREGLLIMTCPVINEYGRTTDNPYHLHEYREEDLINIVNRMFRIITLERIEGPAGPEYRAVLANIKERRYLQGKQSGSQ